MEFIYEVKNNLSKEECEDIIIRFEKEHRKYPGRVVGGINENIKKSTDFHLFSSRNDNRWKDIDDLLFKRLLEGKEEYIKYIDEYHRSKTGEPLNQAFCSKVQDTGFQIQRMKKGGYYTWHNDGFVQENRVISYIWYLNTLEEEDGGETEFLDKKIRPTQGTLLFFPATWTYVHRGCEVKGKTKYIITGFIMDRENINNLLT
jgi:Rps23 Pro-64 3,4-dihydroxylase Tpa1-like proline 4-hydroxylase